MWSFWKEPLIKSNICSSRVRTWLLTLADGWSSKHLFLKHPDHCYTHNRVSLPGTRLQPFDHRLPVSCQSLRGLKSSFQNQSSQVDCLLFVATGFTNQLFLRQSMFWTVLQPLAAQNRFLFSLEQKPQKQTRKKKKKSILNGYWKNKSESHTETDAQPFKLMFAETFILSKCLKCLLYV